jgi:hypothetical protein
MFSEKWRTRFRKAGRALIYVVVVVYLFMLYDKISSMQSDIDSIQSDVSSIEDGSCSNSRICE